MNNMNQMGFNNIGMNPMGMNFMQINNNGMYPIRMNNQPNLMNGMEMDGTAQNIKNIIQPYENKIRELEEIIKQKDFEIIVLKQKLQNFNSTINYINMNPMMMNMSMNQNIGNRGKEISLNIKKNKNIFNIKCFEYDKASILKEKFNLNNNEKLTYYFKLIDDDLTIKENGIIDGSIINVTSNLMINVSFKDKQRTNLILEGDCPVGYALIHYCLMRNVFLIFDFLNYNISFLFNARRLEIQNKTTIYNLSGSTNFSIIITYKQ